MILVIQKLIRTELKIFLSVFFFTMIFSDSALCSEKLPKLVVYKTPTCGCCGKWVDYMKANGFEAEVIEKKDIKPIKKQLGITDSSFWSCHTAKIGKYVIEGHVPAEDVKKLLKSKRDVYGISVPNMPIGSPGMEVGEKIEPYDVVVIPKNGNNDKVEIFSSHSKIKNKK